MNKRIFLAIFIGIFSIMPILGMNSQIASEGLKLISTYAIRAGICYAGNLADTLIHEGGHALAGMALGKKLEKFEIGDPNGKYVFALSKFSINPLDIKEGTTHFTNLKKGTKDFIITAAGPLTALGIIKALIPLAKDNKLTYFLLMSCAISEVRNIIPGSNFHAFMQDLETDNDEPLIASDNNILWYYICKYLTGRHLLEKATKSPLWRLFELGLLGAHYYYQYRAVSIKLDYG